MITRIRKFMDFQGLTPSELADSIGVQRSNVSHVLNGRNLPSFPFIEKLLKTYPKLNAKWLIMGEGEMMEGKPVLPNQLFITTADLNKHEKPIQAEETEKKLSEQIPKPAPVAEASSKLQSSPPASYATTTKTDTLLTEIAGKQENKKVEKIVLFYTDKTFSVYQPEP